MVAALKRRVTAGPDARQLERMARTAPFVLRIARWRDVTGPVLIVKERWEAPKLPAGNGKVVRGPGAAPPKRKKRENYADRGHVSGEIQRLMLPLLRTIVARVKDAHGVPLHLERWLTTEAMRQPITLPLDEESGAKLALIFRLQERVADRERIELMVRRIERLTREEAQYFLTRTTRFGNDANRWAVSGLRILLGGQAKDPAVARTLGRLRAGL